MKIAVVQQNHNPGRVEENRAKAEQAARTALNEGAELILFHEEMLCGYTPDAAALAEPLHGPTTAMFQSLLHGTGACIVYGLTERDGQKLYISAPVVTEDAVLCYRKTHLYGLKPGLRNEPALFTPGDGFLTFRHKGAHIGVMICYDGDFPQVVEHYRAAGCQMVLWMNNRHSRGPEDLVQFYAARHSMIMAASCCCGTDELGQPCPGGSNVVDHTGQVLCQLWDAEGILYVEVCPEEVPDHRARNPWLLDARTDLY